MVVADVEIEGEYQFERRQFGSNPEHPGGTSSQKLMPRRGTLYSSPGRSCWFADPGCGNSIHSAQNLLHLNCPISTLSGWFTTFRIFLPTVTATWLVGGKGQNRGQAVELGMAPPKHHRPARPPRTCNAT